jgi:hypothetical protein
MSARMLTISAGIIVLVAAGAAYGGLTRSAGPNTQKQADLYAIEKIEKTWHRATSRKNLDLMMTLWAKNATFTIADQTYSGKKQIRAFLAKAGPFQPQNKWISDTPAYKMRVSVNGNKGTLYFECHYIDSVTGKLAIPPVGQDTGVRKINGKWLIVSAIGSSAVLKP